MELFNRFFDPAGSWEVLSRYAHVLSGITWIGLLIILWVALSMIYEGSHEVTCEGFGFGCSETLWEGFLHRLGWGPGPAEVLPPAP